MNKYIFLKFIVTIQVHYYGILHQQGHRTILAGKDKACLVSTLAAMHSRATLHNLLFQGKEQKLTTKESELLKVLSKNIGKEVDRNDLLKAVWGDDNYFNGRSMDVYIAKLRKALKGDEAIEIMNVHGKGFKLIVKGE